MDPNAQPEIAAPAPRGRGQHPPRPRGPRNKGRGRAQGQPPLPTIQQRAMQVAQATGVPTIAQHPAPMPKSQLNAMMEAHFHVELEPTVHMSDVLIDTSGYADLCSETYRAVTSVEPKLAESLSEAEFLLCSGQILAHRVLYLRNRSSPVYIAGYVELNEAMNAIDLIPEPIAQYLDGLGLFRDPTGVILRPEIVLPRHDVHNHTVGMLPSLLSDNYAGTTSFNYMSAMFQYGLLERKIVDDGTGNGFANAANFYTQMDPANAGPTDVHLTTAPAALPRSFESLDANFRRVNRMTQVFFDANQIGVLNSIRFDPRLFNDYMAFIHRLKSHISCVPYSKDTSGSPAMLVSALALDGTVQIRPNSFDFGAYGALTNAEMHFARLFRYREDHDAAARLTTVNGVDRHLSFRRSPAHLHCSAPLTLTRMREVSNYTSFYVRTFLR